MVSRLFATARARTLSSQATGDESQGTYHLRYGGMDVISTLALPELPPGDDPGPPPEAGGERRASSRLDHALRVETLPSEPAREVARIVQRWHEDLARTDATGDPAKDRRAPAHASRPGHGTQAQPAGAALDGERWQDGRRCLRVAGIGAAVVSADLARIALWADPHAPEDAVRHMLLDHVLPRVLAGRGVCVLRGSAVATPGGRVLVLLGDAGYGKSTLATAFDVHGGLALTDDCVIAHPTPAGIRAVPSYAGLRLWPDSREALLAHRAIDRRAPAEPGARRRIPPPVLGEHVVRHLVDGFLALSPPAEDDRLTLQLAALSSADARNVLVEHAFQLDPEDHAQRAVIDARAARLVPHAPTYRLRHPRRFDALPDVVATVSRYFDGR